jgi:hypothetical protein
LAPCFIATGRLSGNDDDAGRELQKKTYPRRNARRLLAAYEYLKIAQKIAMVVLVWWILFLRLDCQYDGSKIPDCVQFRIMGTTHTHVAETEK